MKLFTNFTRHHLITHTKYVMERKDKGYLAFGKKINSVSPKLGRDVTKISSCRVNTTSRRGIKQLEISFGSICLIFFDESRRGHVHSSRGKSPTPAS